MPKQSLPPYGSTKSLIGTAAYTEAHKNDPSWFSRAKRNPLYDPSSPEYEASLIALNHPNPTIQNPLITPPTVPATAPQMPPAVSPQPQSPSQGTITMPEMFQQNYNAGPSAIPGGNQGIKMPDITKPLQGFGGTNWNDLLSVAHNRYQR